MSTVDIRVPNAKALEEASHRLSCGELVVLPTETVYGLAGATLNPEALSKIFTLKGRPQNNPLIAHVLDAQQAQELTPGWDDRCALLAKHFWPGPLTLVLRRGHDVPERASAGLDTIAVRCPSHPVIRDVLELFGQPVSAPSANRSGRISPTCAEHVAQDYESHKDACGLLVLDGGPCTIGIESTVLDVSNDTPRILREGAVDADCILKLLGDVEVACSREQIHSPGTSHHHYAPHTRTKIANQQTIASLINDPGISCGSLVFKAIKGALAEHTIVMSTDPARYAEALYASLRELDALNLDLLLVEEPPKSAGWSAIHDRLQRASSPVSTTRSAGGGSSGGSS